MIRLPIIVLILSLLGPSLVTNPCIVYFGDAKGKATSSRANELQLMESDQLPRLPSAKFGWANSDSDPSSRSFVSPIDQKLKFLDMPDNLNPDHHGPSHNTNRLSTSSSGSGRSSS